MPNISISKSGPGAQALFDALAKIHKSEVLVGIPQERASRRGQQINNAELMYIHTNGSPIRHIPARPVIEPAIMADGNRQAIQEELADAAAAWLENDPVGANKFLRRAGIAGMNASKAWFTDPRNNWAPNAPSTVKSKLAKMSPGKRKAAEEAIDAAGGDATGIVRPLIDTGALRKAITFVVRTGQ